MLCIKHFSSARTKYRKEKYSLIVCFKHCWQINTMDVHKTAVNRLLSHFILLRWMFFFSEFINRKHYHRTHSNKTTELYGKSVMGTLKTQRMKTKKFNFSGLKPQFQSKRRRTRTYKTMTYFLRWVFVSSWNWKQKKKKKNVNALFCCFLFDFSLDIEWFMSLCG